MVLLRLEFLEADIRLSEARHGKTGHRTSMVQRSHLYAHVDQIHVKEAAWTSVDLLLSVLFNHPTPWAQASHAKLQGNSILHDGPPL